MTLLTIDGYISSIISKKGSCPAKTKVEQPGKTPALIHQAIQGDGSQVGMEELGVAEHPVFFNGLITCIAKSFHVIIIQLKKKNFKTFIVPFGYQYTLV
jgi:hypothetical protein